MKRFKKCATAVLLCACLLLGGSVKPFYAHAAFGDDDLGQIVDQVDQEEGEVLSDDTESSSQAASESPSDRLQQQADQISDKLDNLKQEQKAIEADLAGVKGEKERAQAEKDAINRQITLTQNEIALLLQRIDVLGQDIVAKQEDIEKKQADIEKKQAEIDDNYAVLKKRLRASYMRDATTTLGLIVGADSFSDLLSRTEYLKRVTDHDRALLKGLAEQRRQMETEKAGLEVDKAKMEQVQAQVDADRKETESKKQVLGVQLGKADEKVQDLVEMERAYLSDLENNKKIQDAAKAELQRIMDQINWSTSPYPEGPMGWPVQGIATITCEFGPRFGGTDYHTGIDISSNNGTAMGRPVLAAQDGTVVTANWAYKQGSGYGIYVLLDHGVNTNGKSVATLYGHLSNITVNVGQTVKKGQQIGNVGSTGWSTGPHLHFEVRLNKTAVNPRPYIIGAS